MIDAIITGKTYGQPTQRVAKTGSNYVVAKVRVPVGDNSVFTNVILF